MKFPLVSVIIPNYNHARFLEERVESILRQTYKKFEIVFLDDHSTDNSLYIIENYKDNSHFSQFVVNNTNSGNVFSQWQQGINLAKGELVWIAESDDTCDPTLLEKLVKEFQHDDNLVLAFSMTRLFKDDGWTFDIPTIDKEPIIRKSGKRFIQRYMAEGCYVTNAGSALFRRDIALTISGHYTKFKNCGDRMFWIEIAEKGKVSIVNEYLNFCRRHGDNLTDKNYKSGLLHKEDKQIMDYLVINKLISPFQCLRASSRYIYGHICNQTVLSSEIKKELMDLWEVGPCRKLYIYMLEIKTILHNLKQKSKKRL